jgi:DNA-binding Lrp family transcriptional regulator
MRKSGRDLKLDAIDRAILAHLQVHGRLSNLDLAARVHLSPSACLRRVKALEEGGVIHQYVALLNPRAVGRHGVSFTIVNLDSTTARQLEAFEQAALAEPEILDCYYVAGSNDYLIRFAYRDAEDLERFHADVLMRLPGVSRTNSLLVLRTVKKTTALPLDAEPQPAGAARASRAMRPHR